MFYFNCHLNRVVNKHTTIGEFKSLPESALGYYKAAFVRNPYDRAYSGFIQLQRDIISQPAADYADEWVRDLVKAQLIENNKRIIEAEYSFDKWIMMLPEYEIYDVGRNTNMPLHPANYWTHHENIQYVDFIGKVENFEKDFIEFCKAVNIDIDSVENGNVTEDDLLESAGYRYVSKMSQSAIHRINEIFRDDFDLFGYEMIK